MGSIAVVGSTNVDMVTYTAQIPDAGQTVTGQRFALGFGGKGANQAAMAARFDVPVYMVSNIGTDVFGETYLANFKKQQVRADFVKQVEMSTGVASIWVEPSGENRIVITPGANATITASEAESALRAIPDLVAVVGQFEIPQEVTAAAFKVARERNALTILNPAPSQKISQELLALTDWLIPNETEFADLHPMGAAPTSDEVISGLSNDLGVKLVVTLGAQGAAFTDTDGKVIRVPAQEVKVVDTTGAGDSFVGAFTYALSFGLTTTEAVVLATRCAAVGVSRFGTQESYPTKSEAQEILLTIAK